MLALNPNAAEYIPTASASTPTAVDTKQREQKQARRKQRVRQSRRNHLLWGQTQAQQYAQWAAFWAYQQGYGYNCPVPVVEGEPDSEDEFYGDYISDEHLLEMADADAWVETMIQLDEEEREHLTAMALELAPAAGWHMEHNLELIDSKGASKPAPQSGRKQRKGSTKSRRTNRAPNP